MTSKGQVLMDMGADFLMCYSDMAAIAESFSVLSQRLSRFAGRAD